MSYKIKFPIPNLVAENERSLNTYIDLVMKYKDHIDSLYFPLGHVDSGIDLWGIRTPNFVYDDSGKLLKENVLKWENAIQAIFEYTQIPASLLLNNTYSPCFTDYSALNKVGKKISFYQSRLTITSIVVSEPLLIPFLVNEVSLAVTLSTNSHTSLAELDRLVGLYGDGIQGIVINRDLNRQVKPVTRWFKSRDILSKLILMVNEGCISHCPYKKSGDLEISIDQVQHKINRIHNLGCRNINATPWLFLTSQFLSKSMIEQHYPDVSLIKLSGRDQPVGLLKYYLQHWVDGVDLAMHKIMNVGELNVTIGQLDRHPSYVHDVMTCNKECFACRKCEQTYNDLIVQGH